MTHPLCRWRARNSSRINMKLSNRLCAAAHRTVYPGSGGGPPGSAAALAPLHVATPGDPRGCGPRLVEHQNQPIHKHRGHIPAVRARPRQIPIHQPADAQSMVELRQQGQPAMRGHGFFRLFQFESKHRVSFHSSHLKILPKPKRVCVVAHP